MSLQQRIAALNAAHVGRVPGEPPRDRPRPAAPRPSPQVPSRRPALPTFKSINSPPEKLNGSITDRRIGNKPAPPPLPVRKQAPSPALPVRKQSADLLRRNSNGSIRSTKTNGTATSKSSDRVKAPAWGECELPILPPKGAAVAQRKYSSERPKYVNRAPSSTSTVATAASQDSSRRPSVPSLPPRLPPRRSQTELRQENGEQEARKIPPMPSLETLEKVKRSALSFGMNKPQTQQQPEVEARPPSRETTSSAPPIPHSSRPDLSSIQATKPKFTSTTSPTASGDPRRASNVCLVCRDYSPPDHQATLFPRQTASSLQALAHNLTSPFPSLTDKARAIFMWLHLNVRYDVENFFRGTIRGSTPQSTLQTGLAVCEGYAALFTNLATHAGLESIIVGGHGKGFGYSPWAPGSPLPPYEAGHAWNAVKIDNGEWKLIDCCWGAGHVQGANMPYIQKFSPDYFSMSNEEFGVKHFPGNKEHFFLPGGRQMSWHDYIQINPNNWPDIVEAPTIFTCAKEDYYIGEKTVMPRSRSLSVNTGGMVRFQFSLLCQHWTLDRHGNKGRPPVFVLNTGGIDGRDKDMMPLEHIRGSSNGGDMWYVDIPAKELGAPGSTLTLFAITSFGNSQSPRGLTVREFREGKGRVGMAFTGVAAWQLTA